MKILERHESYNDWKLEITCDSINGHSCGSKLEINKDDLDFQPRSNHIVYGVTCPVCGAFIEIAPNLIPEIFKKK